MRRLWPFHSLDPAWSRFRQTATSAWRTLARCRWSSSCTKAKSQLILKTSNLVWPKVVSGRYRGVSFFQVLFFFLFLFASFHLHLVLAFCEGTAVRDVFFTATCINKQIMQDSTHTDYVKVTSGTTCLDSTRADVKIESFVVAHMTVHPWKPCHGRCHKPGEPQYMRPMVLGFSILEDLLQTLCVTTFLTRGILLLLWCHHLDRLPPPSPSLTITTHCSVYKLLNKKADWSERTGNNYAIMNESNTHPAKIFFAQGCEMQSSVNQFEDMERESESQSWVFSGASQYLPLLLCLISGCSCLWFLELETSLAFLYGNWMQGLAYQLMISWWVFWVGVGVGVGFNAFDVVFLPREGGFPLFSSFLAFPSCRYHDFSCSWRNVMRNFLTYILLRGTVQYNLSFDMQSQRCVWRLQSSSVVRKKEADILQFALLQRLMNTDQRGKWCTFVYLYEDNKGRLWKKQCAYMTQEVLVIMTTVLLGRRWVLAGTIIPLADPMTYADKNDRYLLYLECRYC